MAYRYPEQSSQLEQQRHWRAIQAIAADLRLPVEEVTVRYEALLTALSAKAKVTEYLPVLIAKKIHRQHKNL